MSTLVRYGTQYAALGQRLDASLSVQVQPPFADRVRQPGSLPSWLGAIGYRNLGPAYEPLDADFDPLSGLHGLYGIVSYSEPDPTVPGFSAASVTAHRFSDALQPRDELTSTSAAVRLGRKGQPNHFSVIGNVSTGTLAASQAARLSGMPFVLRDDQSGTTYLRQSSYSVSMTSTSDAHQATLGYTQGRSPNCDPTIAVTPCFTFRQPSVTASLFWQAFRDLFVAGQIKNQNDTSLSLVSGPAQSSEAATSSSQPTTASHIVRSAVVGAFLFNSRCSTLTVSTENRGGAFETFSSNPPAPGFTNTAALELVPTATWPTLLIAYSRTGTLGTAPTTQFLIRARYGLPEHAFRTDVRQACVAR